MILMRIGGQSGAGSSSGSRTGNQKRRNSSPIGVPWLVWVISALSSALNMATRVPPAYDPVYCRTSLHWDPVMWFHGPSDIITRARESGMYNGVKVLDVHGHVSSPE